jgi:hypothetical protein
LDVLPISTFVSIRILISRADGSCCDAEITGDGINRTRIALLSAARISYSTTFQLESNQEKLKRSKMSVLGIIRYVELESGLVRAGINSRKPFCYGRSQRF